MKANREARRPLGGRNRRLLVVILQLACLVAEACRLATGNGYKKSVGGAAGDTPRVAAGASGQPNAASIGEHSRKPGGDDYRAIDRHALSIPKAAEFFFQAEDGIRDIGVTGVQTCALPI